ncbi:MAG: hypothetical protein ACTHNM_17190 [Dyella sp.]|uniref:hypothetical protein n=1 Tax=Dyella sp. TaxID=1869338 RepID=UPI003F814F23
MHAHQIEHDPRTYTTIAQRFAAERARLALPLATVAAMCAVSTAEVAEWESDGGMTAEHLQACAALGMSVPMIVLGSDNPMRDRTRARWQVIAALRERGASIDDAFLIADGVGPVGG